MVESVMLSINRITGIYSYNYYGKIYSLAASNECCGNIHCNARETITTWRFDEEGNIVYYTKDKKTGEILSIVKYKNPNKINNYNGIQ